VASWKGRSPEGSVVHDLVDFTDFFRTLAEAGGGQVPSDRIVDGLSFLPHITGQPGRERPWVFCDFNNVDREWLTPARFAHDRRYKLYGTKYVDSNPKGGLFYDLWADPDEANPIEPGRETTDERTARAVLQHVLDNIDSGTLNLGDRHPR
jgi:arylsulfatase A-like enzyme